MKSETQHLVHVIRILYRFGLLEKDAVFDILNSQKMRTWQRISQLEKILDKHLLYNFPDGED